MDRREFLKLLLASGAATLVNPKLKLIAQEQKDEEKKDEEKKFNDAEVWVAEGGDDAGKMAEAVIKEMGGMGKFIKKGERVVIKPNIAFDREESLAATTNPAVVATVAKLAVDAGAKEVIVLDRSVANPKTTYEKSGIKKAIEAVKGVKLVYPDWKGEFGYVEKQIDGGVSLKSWSFLQEVIDCDVLINLPIAKTHGGATLTLSVKNLLGIVGGNRGKLHGNLHQNIVDLTRFVKDKTRLVLIDAFRILVEKGPQGGKPEFVRNPKVIIGAKNMFTADAYATKLFTAEEKFKDLVPEKLPFLKLGFEQNLGEIRLDKITVHKVKL